MSKPNKKLVVVSLVLLSNTLFAASRVIIDDTSSLLNPVSGLQNLDKNNYQFKIVNKIILPDGSIKHKYKQYYKNIPIWNNSIISDKNVTQNNTINNITNDANLTGSYLVNIEEDIDFIDPKLSEENALSIAKLSIGLAEDAPVKNTNVTLTIKNYQDIAKLVYIIDFFVDDVAELKPSRPYFIIDANSGEVIEQWDGLTTLDDEEQVKAIGPGGNEKTGKYSYGKDYGPLLVTKKDGQCQMDSPNVLTMDFQNKPDWMTTGSGGIIHKFDCTDDSVENNYREINGGYSPINDAHYFGNVVFNMYKEWYNTAPLTFKLILKTHYRKNFDNALWTGKVMLFGDGHKVFYPVVALDVVAHEVSHGFTQQNSNLIYKRQSGGINESFSDIAGEAAKYFFNAEKPVEERNDWMVGASIFKGDKDEALRYFIDPTRDGKSIDHAKNYKNTVNVHYSSGIFNKAFYILATTENWDLKKAFDVFILANRTYWTEESTFDEAGCGLKKAAEDLKVNSDDIINAFDKVGVNATCKKSEPEPDPNPDTTPVPDKPSDPDTNQPKPDDKSTPAPEDAINLKNGVPYFGVSAGVGESKLFYIDLDNTKKKALNAWFWGGMGQPILQIAYNRIPSNSDYDCDTSFKRNIKTCNIKKPIAGRYFIRLVGKSEFDKITLWALAS